MIIFFILGAIIGSFSVVFVLQNTAPVSVTFLSSEIEGSLAIILTFTFVGGVLTTILFLLPSLVADWIHTSQLKRQVKTLGADLDGAKEREHEATVRAKQVETATPTTVND
ncbi:MAG: LapA family protein [Candidatus Paceibacterota bacterium]